MESESTSSERLDRYLVRLGFAPSRRAASELVARGRVRINGRRSRKGDLVRADDRIEVEAPADVDTDADADGAPGAPASVSTSTSIAPNPDLGAAIDLLYEDEAVLVVNKPGLMPCHPLRRKERDTVMNAIVARCPETALAGDKPLEGGLVHRLDNGTSGALIVARTPDSFSKLRDAIRSGKVSRRYQALVAGHLDHRLELIAPIAHHAKNPRKMMIGAAGATTPKRAGRRAVTIVEPVQRAGPFTLVSVAPKTGSRHQIRVHLADAGFPLVGDTLYGGPAAATLPEGRFWLHLSEVSFESPARGPITVSAPLKPELAALIAAAR
ncbi:MAG TPA: RluA family pseudouridine synthase [Candidatus Binataceae bacterium]